MARKGYKSISLKEAARKHFTCYQVFTMKVSKSDNQTKHRLQKLGSCIELLIENLSTWGLSNIFRIICLKIKGEKQLRTVQVDYAMDKLKSMVQDLGFEVARTYQMDKWIAANYLRWYLGLDDNRPVVDHNFESQFQEFVDQNSEALVKIYEKMGAYAKR